MTQWLLNLKLLLLLFSLHWY